MPVYSRKQLSGLTNGMLAVTATTAAAAHTVHTVQATSTSALECVWLSINSRSAGHTRIHLVWDDATATGREVAPIVADFKDSNIIPIFEGLPLTATTTILYSYLSDVAFGGPVNIYGYYNEIATG